MLCNKGIYKGDDTNAFGQSFLTITATYPEGWVISKAEIRIGGLELMVFENPVFPLTINLSHEQTRLLQEQNNVYMKIYDNLDRGQTCNGTITILAKDEVV